MQILDASEFVRDTLLPRLAVHRLDRAVVLHPTCAARKLGTDSALIQVCRSCVTRADVPKRLDCCATAGDRGLLYPELTSSALAEEHAEVRAGHYHGYYCTNLTCEIGLRQATGLPYSSFLYLVNEATTTQQTGCNERDV